VNIIHEKLTVETPANFIIAKNVELHRVLLQVVVQIPCEILIKLIWREELPKVEG